MVFNNHHSNTIGDSTVLDQYIPSTHIYMCVHCTHLVFTNEKNDAQHPSTVWVHTVSSNANGSIIIDLFYYIQLLYYGDLGVCLTGSLYTWYIHTLCVYNESLGKLLYTLLEKHHTGCYSL